MSELSVNLNGLKLQNPVITASGTCGYGLELTDYLDIGTLGAISTKGLSLNPHEGNPPDRIAETAAGMLNAIGLQNIGAEAFATEKLPRLRELGAAVIVNVWGNEIKEFVAVVERLDSEEGIAAFELNISCPNISREWTEFGINPELSFKLVKAVRQATDKHLMVKLSPNAADITEIGLAAQEAGANSLSAINTVLGLEIDVAGRRPYLQHITGGLSGPAIRPIGLRCVWQLYEKVNIPVIGVGGISSAEDAVKYIYAGAAAIQIGTAVFLDPTIPAQVIEALGQFCETENVEHISDLVGIAHRNVADK